MRTLPSAAAVLAAALLAAGCAGMNTVTSDVSSFGEWPRGRAPGSYTFERLPSQQAAADQQAALEDAARPALQKAGFVPAAPGARADVTVQVGARVTRTQASPWDDPFWWRWGAGYWHGIGRRGGFGLSASFPLTPATQYEREVALLIRDNATGNPLYETRASSSGTGYGGTPTLAAMYQAALADFPLPAISPRRISVPVVSQ
jgi:hypothetical protein